MNATAQIAECIRRTAGLDPLCFGRTSFERAIHDAFRRSQTPTLDDYREQLEHSDQARAELIEAVIILETWFFRGREAFTALRDWVLTEWLPNHAGRMLRVLSAACSTGEEPYSAAMTLLDAGLPASAFSIDALDISAPAIALAKRASYQKNSFREKNTDFRERYFEKIDGQHVFRPAVHAAVNFRVANLAPQGIPASANYYDIIFCRNLLIYLDAATQQRILESCWRCLSPGGLLFLGPGEASLVSPTQFTSLKHARAFAFRKQANAETAKKPTRPRSTANASPWARPIKPVRSVPEVELRKILPCSKPHRESRPCSEYKKPAVDPCLLEIERLANQGRLEAAATLCRTHLRERGDSAATYFWLGMIHDAAGKIEVARDSYRKAVYLQPNHAEALWHLALLAEKHDSSGEAHRWRRRAERQQQRSRR